MIIDYNKLLEPVISGEATKVTKYVSPKLVVKAVRHLTGGKIDKRDSIIQISLTIGAPNYTERLFIRDCQQVNEPFPVKRMIIKPYAPKKK